MLQFKSNKFKEWWQTLAMRERYMLSIGAVGVLFFVLYAIVWSPMLSAANHLRSNIVDNEKLLAWMQSTHQEITQLKQNAFAENKSYSPVEMISILQYQINQAGINEQMAQIKQTTKETVEMHLQKVEFDKLLKMLVKLNSENSITISRLSVKADRNAVGIVSAEVSVG